jgi:hypothetical protein
MAVRHAASPSSSTGFQPRAWTGRRGRECQGWRGLVVTGSSAGRALSVRRRRWSPGNSGIGRGRSRSHPYQIHPHPRPFMEGAEKAKPPHPHTASSVAGSGRVPDQLLLSSCSTSGWAILFRFLHPDRCAGGQATGMCSFPEHHAGFIRAVYCVCGSRCGRSVERQSVLAVSGSEVSLSSKPVSGAWAIGN